MLQFTYGILVGVAAVFLPASASGEVGAADDEAYASPELIDRLRAQANEALGRGRWLEARRHYEEILAIAPRDAPAQREAGRAAHAAGDFIYAVRVLESAHHDVGHHADPELHYLRGEALFALGERDEALREHRIAELEIGDHPMERMPMLWRARILARRGELAKADRIYEAMWPAAGQPVDAEVALSQAEAHTMTNDWNGVVPVLRRLLAREANHLRGRQMLAWALEATGDIEEELALRRRIAVDTGLVESHRDYGRALERAHDYRGALREYRTAERLGGNGPDPLLARAIERMRNRIAPEVAATAVARMDPAAVSLRALAGAALPFGSRHIGSVTAWHEASRGGFPSADGSATGLGGALVLVAPWGSSASAGANIRYTGQRASDGDGGAGDNRGAEVGALAGVESPLGRYLQIDMRGDLNNEWSESPATIQVGGATTGVTGHLFVFPVRSTRRILLDTGVQARRLSVAPVDPAGRSPEARQLLLWVGADFVLWQNPLGSVRGEMLDDQLMRRSYLTDAVVLSFRHHRLRTLAEQDFTARLALAPQAQVTTGMLSVRRAGLDGRVGVDARAGLGYDPERRFLLYSGGLAVVIAPTQSSRLAVGYDLGVETRTGLSGRLHTLRLSYHADL